MSKTYKNLLLVIMSFVLMISLVGCAPSLVGKTYVYESFEYELSEDLTEIEKGIAEVAATAVKKVYENIEISFNEEGKCTLGSYTQDGSTLLIGNTEYKIKGSKIVLEIVEKNYSVKIVFAVKK